MHGDHGIQYFTGTTRTTSVMWTLSQIGPERPTNCSCTTPGAIACTTGPAAVRTHGAHPTALIPKNWTPKPDWPTTVRGITRVNLGYG
jgi:hypothetical protein